MPKTFNPALKGDGELCEKILRRIEGEKPLRGAAAVERAALIRKELAAARYQEWLAEKRQPYRARVAARGPRKNK